MVWVYWIVFFLLGPKTLRRNLLTEGPGLLNDASHVQREISLRSLLTLYIHRFLGIMWTEIRSVTGPSYRKVYFNIFLS